VWMLTGIEHKSGQKLATFNPYEILELPEAGRNDDGKPVSMSQIKAVSVVQLDSWHTVDQRCSTVGVVRCI